MDLSRAENIIKRIEELAVFSEDENGVSRFFGTKNFLDCGKKIFGWMETTGLQTTTDNIGNIRGKLVSKDPNAKTFVIASHFDTEIRAGKFAGALGILIGLEIADHFISHKILLPYNLEIIAFSAEKGARFHSKNLAGKVIAGSFPVKLLDINDEEGNSLSDVLTSMKLDIQNLETADFATQNWLGYFEINIEGGPVLYDRDIPVGIVKSIAGQKKIQINISGETGDVGTFPMNMRKDALCAAAQFILEVEEYARREKRNLVATVGEITVCDASSDLIPGKVSCILDIRSSNNILLSEAYEDINQLCEDICDKRKIYFEWKLLNETEAVDCDEDLISLLSKSVKANDIELTELISGSGHTAQVIAGVAPVIILFVKCFKGITHNPMENVKIEDIATALEVSTHFVQSLKSVLKRKK